MSRQHFSRQSRLLACLPIIAMIFGLHALNPVVETDYPKKQIDWIVPYAPGGGYDAYSRAIAKILPT